MNSLGLNLPIFFNLLSWGNHECTLDAKIYYERTALMVSDELPNIIRRWHKPPRPKDTHHVRASGSRTVLQDFVFDCVSNVLDEELRGIEDLARCPPEDVSKEGLTSILIEDLVLCSKVQGLEGLHISGSFYDT
ncbi:hypothetical protein SERLA73DRAFT_75461 [Serpula lacrymans var. lacrymans S7.3]|uniref:Uncharacterized protein n=2 Tax=Serpula lacrymans var. lacrymans TaxID=341189 RepID=F8Q4U0_SERL3|nr:uncharacterized protein SERLADRAFT_440161 [Serpula lacrymans var. lacrymans S7.9]EGN96567.1 hypothetical protein SERLA73DRAFT_75461 [Serpula lacrymans var. lacrymans S7.3]EGO22142.1 hypothetical protein SERLADRAFT_440161 [Serpula lacrymans var. lacrymans S7.9]